MAFIQEPGLHVPLADYAAVAHLAAAVEQLRADAAKLVPRLRGRTIWLLNATGRGGGVAELLPTQIALFRDLGLDARWLVMNAEGTEFFSFTKQLHNMIHGTPADAPTADQGAMYESVSRRNAEAITNMVRSGDIVIVHDPQPLATGVLVRRAVDVRLVWRCHIGLDKESPHARAAWEFLKPYIEEYDRIVFSLADYAPAYARDRLTVIHPSIDPLSHKNRDLSLHKLIGILCDSGLVRPHWPLLAPPFPQRARRLQPAGTFSEATGPDDIGLPTRPIITQVSRWDRLKGFGPLLEAFADLKRSRGRRGTRAERHRRSIEHARLVLAGPDPEGIQDDPEALEVLNALAGQYLGLDPELRGDVIILALPMESRKENALMVNALQRSSDVVVQNSLREGFGLTVAEAMWKRNAMLGSAQASGVRLQIRDGAEGRLIQDPEDSEAIAGVLHDMLADPALLDEWGQNAQRRVHDEFLIFGELRKWLALLAQL
ncbi:MAG: glycosyltransferase [Gemmatimonadota bacterium]